MDIEGTTDGFVQVTLGNEKHETDTHYRNTDGECSWNYRCLFNFKYYGPDHRKNPDFHLKV